MGETENAYSNVAANPVEKGHLRNLEVVGMIILKWVLQNTISEWIHLSLKLYSGHSPTSQVFKTIKFTKLVLFRWI
jgi:hypothetical protein